MNPQWGTESEIEDRASDPIRSERKGCSRPAYLELEEQEVDSRESTRQELKRVEDGENTEVVRTSQASLVKDQER